MAGLQRPSWLFTWGIVLTLTCASGVLCLHVKGGSIHIGQGAGEAAQKGGSSKPWSASEQSPGAPQGGPLGKDVEPDSGIGPQTSSDHSTDGNATSNPVPKNETYKSNEADETDVTVAGRSPASDIAVPILYTIAKSYLFFGLKALGGTNPPDAVPDPAIEFLNVGPSSITITRYSDGPFGAWDQVNFSPGFAKIRNTSVIGVRPTFAYVSSPIPAAYDFPTHVPGTLARFEWISRSDGAEDLRIFSPPGSSREAAYFRGLYTLPGVSVPFPNTTTYVPESLLADVVSVVTGFDNGIPIIGGHQITTLSIKGPASLGCFQDFELDLDTIPAIFADKSILKVGLVLLEGTQWGLAPGRCDISFMDNNRYNYYYC